MSRNVCQRFSPNTIQENTTSEQCDKKVNAIPICSVTFSLRHLNSLNHKEESGKRVTSCNLCQTFSLNAIKENMTSEQCDKKVNSIQTCSNTFTCVTAVMMPVEQTEWTQPVNQYIKMSAKQTTGCTWDVQY